MNNKRTNCKSIICIEKIPQQVIRELSLATLKGAINFIKSLKMLLLLMTGLKNERNHKKINFKL